MRIAIFGLGYVGITAAVCLAHQGHTIFGIDPNPTKVDDVNGGRSPIIEPRVEEMLQAAVRDGRLTASTSGMEQIDACDIAMVCVGTPSAPDGSNNLSFIAEVSRQIARAVSPSRSVPLTVVYRSTIPPGTIQKMIRPIFRAALGDAVDAVALVYNPEFLREATAVEDYFAPSKIVIGTADATPNAHLLALYKDMPGAVFHTSYAEAEITKFVDNSFHALKVAFGNEIGRLSVLLGISASKVHEIFVSDSKLNISAKYFRPGGAFGGSCLPKDVRALQYMSARLQAATPVIDSLIRSNDAHKAFIFDQVTDGLAPNASVLMLGLTFKAGSDDLRESQNVDLARRLLDNGYQLSIYEPCLQPARLIGQNLGYGFTHLPGLSDLLITRETAEARVFDRVVDTSGLQKSLSLISQSVLNISQIA